MSRFIVEGGHRLSGSIRPQGNKNEALAILSTVLLTAEKVEIQNLPRIVDVFYMIKILESLGVEVQELDEHRFSFEAGKIQDHELSSEWVGKIRGSLTLIAPLIFRLGSIFFPKPGGDKIGRRRIDTHILALSDLGVEIETTQEGYWFRASEGFRSADILLDEASVTATENAVMAASLASGESIIRNSASEPHVQQLCHCLNRMGAKIRGIGSNILIIQGVEQLSGTSHRIESDYLEVGSFIGMAVATQSEILIQDAGIPYLRMILNAFERIGIRIVIRGQDLWVPRDQSLEIRSDFDGAIIKIEDGPWPSFPADLMSVLLVVATQCRGTVLIFEKMFESRLFFVDKLISMGAKIVLCDPHRAVVIGPSSLSGQELVSPDIRAGIALLIAALSAQGQSVIHNIIQIDRGYESMDLRLRSLGAKISRES